MSSSILGYLSFLWSFNFWISVIVIFILKSIIQTWVLRKRMPPGPFPLPLLGNLLIFKGAKVGTHESALELSKKYGDPMTIFFGNFICVVLTKYEMAKNILQQTTFSNRPESAMMDLILGGSQDIAFGKYGPVWQFHRKITSKNMRSLIDAEKLEYKVLKAVDFTLEDMLKHSESVDPKLYIRHVVYNILSSFAYGQTYKLNDTEFRRLTELNDRSQKEFSAITVFDFLPFAKYLPMKRIPMIASALDVADEFKMVPRRQIEEHRRSFIEGELRDFCDALIHEQNALKAEGPEQAQQLTDDHMMWILSDFFNAGTDTTTSVLTWFILYMVINPKIQEECYQTIIDAIGDRIPRIGDRLKMPFVEACIMETLRMRPVAPMALPHSPISDTKIGDYFIPQGSIILPNIYAMHIDPEYWQNPLEFDPRLHFLDETGQLKKPQSFAPFGFGRRVCIGEQLAKNDLFLVVVRFLQKIRLEPLEGIIYKTDYDLAQDLSLVALPFSIRISLRR